MPKSAYQRKCAILRYERVRKIVAFIYKQGHHSFRQADIARALGVHHTIIARLLPLVEAQGVRLYEDERGRLAVHSIILGGKRISKTAYRF